MGYDHKRIEPKWQAFWEREKTFRAVDFSPKPKLYILDMFPYPSGAGLHVGHPEGYTATDIVARYKRMRGFNVLHPMGWDAFGLPAENYAIQTGTHPAVTTRRNIETFRRQIKALGFSYDWDREIDTTDPAYYRWTQWIFLEIYRAGLAYEAEVPINWCEACKTGLANEEVREGVCDRCGGRITRRSIRQWMLRITAYAQRLLEDLEELDWPESIKEMQRNWIGRSDGADVVFRIPAIADSVSVFTTRPDTLYGATYVVLAPEHPLVERVTAPDRRAEVAAYRAAAAGKSDLDRTDLAREKTGVFTGGYAVNPVNGRSIPIWISDYVLMTYGTGAIMAVPAHDQRDWEFARRFDLPIVEVVTGGDIEKGAHEGDGRHVGSPVIDGLDVPDGIRTITAWLEGRGLGRASVHYKLRDWVFSRQRYWGEPIPVLHTEDGGVRPLSDADLPLELPEVARYEPTGTGESPLAAIRDWVETVDPEAGRPARRETNTMPQWAGSCWYYLRYLDPHDDVSAWDRDKERYWMPVDLYVGGAEHAVLHLLYARFWHKVLYDLGHVSTKEPFRKLINQGLILGEDGEKMSKSRGNVINPDDIVESYGADAMRLYEMFLGPLERVKPWSTRGLEGVSRFIRRAWGLILDDGDRVRGELNPEPPGGDEARILAKTIQAVTADVDGLRFNTAIARLMEFVNAELKIERPSKPALETFVLLLSPFAPHVCEDLWEKLGHRETIAYEPWPEYDPERIRDEVVTIPIQIDGKLRDRIEAPVDIGEEELRDAVLGRERVRAILGDRPPRRFVYVPRRMVSIVR